MITTDMVNKFIEELKKEPMVKKNLYKYPWLSGSSTTVYPISVRYKSHNSNEIPHEIILQWNSDKRCDKFINKIVEGHKEIIESGRFWKSDGSCPSTITFKLK